MMWGKPVGERTGTPTEYEGMGCSLKYFANRPAVRAARRDGFSFAVENAGFAVHSFRLPSVFPVENGARRAGNLRLSSGNGKEIAPKMETKSLQKSADGAFLPLRFVL